MSWRDRSACLGATKLFYGTHVCDSTCNEGLCSKLDQRSPVNLRINEDAKQVCKRCPVLGECREWILSNPRDCEHGVVAGMSENERRRITWAETKRAQQKIA